MAQTRTEDFTVAPAGPGNSRNSEAAIIHRKDGSLLLAWTQFYGVSGSDEAPAKIVGKVSRDGGRTWGPEWTLVRNDGGCNVMEVYFLRLNDGRLALFHCQKNTPDTDCRIIMRTSSDEGLTWSDGRELTEAGHYIALTNGRGLRLKSGRILVETWEAISWQKPNNVVAFCLISGDDGKTWRRGGNMALPNDFLDEPCAVELKDGRVLMLARSERGAQYASFSSDGGETWSKPEPTALAGPSAPVYVTRIPKTGDLLAIWNHNPKNATRRPLTAALSKDEGKTWSGFRDILNADGEQYAYPAITWDKGNALLTYFTYRGGLSLQLKIIPQEWFYEK